MIYTCFFELLYQRLCEDTNLAHTTKTPTVVFCVSHIRCQFEFACLTCLLHFTGLASTHTILVSLQLRSTGVIVKVASCSKCRFYRFHNYAYMRHSNSSKYGLDWLVVIMALKAYINIEEDVPTVDNTLFLQKSLEHTVQEEHMMPLLRYCGGLCYGSTHASCEKHSESSLIAESIVSESATAHYDSWRTSCQRTGRSHSGCSGR